MLFMVIERFKPSGAAAIGERVARHGRMLPEGVVYHASWVDAERNRCFQIMESPGIDLLHEWAGQWNDLIAFEIIPVVTSAEYWASR